MTRRAGRRLQTNPEGDKIQYTYQSLTRDNVTEVRRISKTAGTPADIVSTASLRCELRRSGNLDQLCKVQPAQLDEGCAA